MDYILDEIHSERVRQDQKWGEQNHSPAEWLMILGEEVGEVNKAALETFFKYKDSDKDYSKYREELIQVAAVAVAMIECLDRNNLVQPASVDEISKYARSNIGTKEFLKEMERINSEKANQTVSAETPSAES
jgi:NTP pyrophosphatase (non-canonical NTP hydrolase)